MADRYWVGGTGSWDATALLKWSSTSGGIGGEAVPTAADDVYIDSGSGVVTVTATSASTCRNLSFISGSGSFAGTFAGTSGITVAGSLTLSASMTRTFTGGITFTATNAQTITPNGISLDSSLIFNGVGGSWQLADNLVAAVVIPSTKAITLTNGTLDLNNKILTTAIFGSNNSNTRVITFGTGKIVLIGSGTILVDTTSQTGFTYTGSGLLESTYSGSTGTRTFNIGRTSGVTESNALSLSITAGSDTVTLNNTQRLKNLTFSGFTGTLTNQSREIYGNLTLSSGMTITAGANATTFAATSGTQQITTNGVAVDNPITQNSPGATVQLQDNLTMGSTRTFTLTAGTLDLNNLVLSTGAASLSNSNTRSIAFGTGKIQLTGSGVTVLVATVNTGLTLTGSQLFEATYSGAVGTRTFAMGSAGSGATEANAINLSVTAGTDIVTVTSARVLGGLDFTGFSGTLSNTSYTLYGSLIFSSGMTVAGGANSITFGATSGTRQITTNGQNLDLSLLFTGVGGTFAFQDALTQSSARGFTITAGTVQFKDGVTSTVGSFVANNSNVKFLQSTTPGSQATLSQASGTVNVVDLTIRDINAVGGASWNAYTDFENTDAGNNDGWNFSLSPPYSTAELPVTLRPFTQPRRF
jgi:fibronectin-binding autotransporter adhesin